MDSCDMISDFSDPKLVNECARVYSASTGLGCTVSDIHGKILYEHGYGCGSCELCQTAGLSRDNCIRSHIYGMTEAERFGGKYIYFCPMGLTCFVSPIIGDVTTTAKITVGPFLMVEPQDFIDCELTEELQLDPTTLSDVIRLLPRIPQVNPRKVQDLSVLLFMAVGFLNNASAENHLLETERSDQLQGQINAYISKLKKENFQPRYPFDKERALLLSFSHGDRENSRKLLQELLAALLVAGGGDLNWMKSRASELIVLITRSVIESGADETIALNVCRLCQEAIPRMPDFKSLSARLVSFFDSFMENLFLYPDARHAGLIQQCIQHISTHYAEHLTLEDTAHAIALSPDYLSRIFSQETGTTFSQYLNNVRIKKAKELIRRGGIRLTDISQMVGYDDQSYFTKVFRRTAGITPSEYSKKVTQRRQTDT